MNLRIVGTYLILGSICAFSQTAHLSFEAASLKPTETPGTPDRVMRRMQGGPGTPDPGRFTYNNIPLKTLVVMAYNLKEFQVEGPDWIDTEGYDLVATMPPGTTQEQAAQMMQTLLTERFKLQFHKETKSLPQFALVVAKTGPKLKEAEVPTAPVSGPPPDPGRGGRGPGTRMMMSPSGVRLSGPITMTQLANMLTRQLARPVLDLTELTKTYDVDITWMPDNLNGPGGGRVGPPPGGDDGDGGHRGPEATMTLAQALQENLGLRLDPRKAPAEVLIVDQASKVPVEN
jgi:uncharacterized protein (TIGR03435 family)